MATEAIRPASFRSARLSLGLTQTAAAKLLGRAVCTVSEWESGHRGIPTEAVDYLIRRARGEELPPLPVCRGPRSEQLEGADACGWGLTDAGILALAQDGETESRIGFAPCCPGECLTWEDHAGHVATLPVVEDSPEDVAAWERDRRKGTGRRREDLTRRPGPVLTRPFPVAG